MKKLIEGSQIIIEMITWKSLSQIERFVIEGQLNKLNPGKLINCQITKSVEKTHQTLSFCPFNLSAGANEAILLFEAVV